jgi:hypothetical protein
MSRSFTIATITVLFSIVVMLVSANLMRLQALTMLVDFVRAQDVIATEEMERHREDEESQRRAHEVHSEAYEAERQEWLETLTEYKADPDAFADPRRRRMGRAPPLPRPPEAPYPPEARSALASHNQAFREHRNLYFGVAKGPAVITALFAIALASSLLFLILFDPAGRIGYLVVFTVLFIFLIGPSLYSTMTTVAWTMRPPPYSQIEGYYWRH